MKWFLSLLLCFSASAQLPIFAYKIPSGASFAPTNATIPLIYWGEITPYNGTYGDSGGTTHPANDGQEVKIWTNFASGTGWPLWAGPSKWTADQTLHPTNFISGGGGNGTSPRILLTAATSTRMVDSTPPTPNTNIFTALFVLNCTASSGVDIIVNGSGTVTLLEYTSNALRMQNNSTGFTGPATLTASQWYIVTMEQNGSTGTIFTNGVQYATGSVGTITLAGFDLFNNGASGFHGNVSRVWLWYGILSAGDHSSAVAQCKKDFGIQ